MNGSAGIVFLAETVATAVVDLVSIELEPGWQREPEVADSGERLFAALIA
jgi:hypothetical protein